MAPRTFTVAASLPDPLTAERIVQQLQEAKIDAFSRAGGAASSDPFASASPGFWDILVANEGLAQAEALIRTELDSLEREGEANAQAAEEEALSGETPVAE